ncbi:MAG: antibiotic biosynthesis monooxygenase [Bdellovibrionota bacterium]
MVDFLENEVSKDEGFVSYKFHTNKERTIFTNYATWKSQKHYEDYKAKTGTVTERARKVIAFKPTSHEVWHIEN